MDLQIYVESIKDSGEYELMNLYQDEKIFLNIKQKDTSDIGKTFSTFSQAFTVPLEGNENKLNFFFNSEIVGDINKNNNLKCKIYINSILFKSGFIYINELRRVKGMGTSVSLTFYSSLVSLKEIIGDDMLSSLTNFYGLPIFFNWGDDAVKKLLDSKDSSNVSFYLPTIVPLVSRNRVLTYGDNGIDDIKFNTTNIVGQKQLTKDELRPAFNLSLILDVISAKYGIIIRRASSFGNFFNGRYESLYIWGNSSKVIGEKIKFPVTNAFSGNSTIDASVPKSWSISKQTNRENIILTKLLNDPVERLRIIRLVFVPERLFGGDDDVEIRMDLKRYGDNKLISSRTVNWSSGIATFDFDLATLLEPFVIGASQELYFEMTPSTIVKWDAIGGITLYVYKENYEGLIGYINSSNVSKSPDNINTLTPYQLIPDMKIIDLIDSIIKMFNISITSNSNSNEIILDTPLDIIPLEIDYSPFIDLDDSTTTTQELYKEYEFSHSLSKYRSNVDYRYYDREKNSFIEYGMIKYISNNTRAKGKYEVKTKFSIPVLTTIRGTSVPTFYGFTNDSPTVIDGALKYKSNYDEFTIFRISEPIVSDPNYSNYTFGMKVGSGVQSFKNPYYLSMVNANSSSPLSIDERVKDSLSFDVIRDTINPSLIINNTLFSDYYKKTVESLSNKNVFYHTFKCYLSSFEMSRFDINNIIIIGEHKYNIEEAKIDITTGIGTLKLINIV